MASRTTSEIKEKWKNLTSSAKKKFADVNRQMRKTGGGPPPKKPTAVQERIINYLRILLFLPDQTAWLRDRYEVKCIFYIWVQVWASLHKLRTLVTRALDRFTGNIFIHNLQNINRHIAKKRSIKRIYGLNYEMLHALINMSNFR